MQGLISAKRRIDKGVEWLCAILLVVMAALAVCQAAAPRFFSGSSAYAEALSRFLFVWMIMYGSAYVFSLKERLDAALLGTRLRGAALLAAELFTGLCLLLFASVALVYGGYVIAAQTASDNLGIPPAVLYSAIPVSGALILFYAVYSAAAALDRFKKGKPEHTV